MKSPTIDDMTRMTRELLQYAHSRGIEIEGSVYELLSNPHTLFSIVTAFPPVKRIRIKSGPAKYDECYIENIEKLVAQINLVARR